MYKFIYLLEYCQVFIAGKRLKTDRRRATGLDNSLEGRGNIMKKRIRRISNALAVVIALIMVFSLSACNQAGSAGTKSLYAQGLEVVQLMSEMAQSEEYVKFYTGSDEIGSMIQTIGSGDFASPQAVYAISVADENLSAIMGLGNLDGVSEKLQGFLKQRVLASLVTQVNAMGGTESLAASSICTAGKIFVNEGATEDVIYLYVYENAAPVAVTFIIGENQAVSASGMFILYDGFTCGSAEEIKSFFQYITVEVSEVLPEQE